MEIISPKHTGRVFYDKFSTGFLKPDYNLLLIDQFSKKNQFSMTLQEYELSKESIIWLSSDLFAERQFDDVWLVFSNAEKTKMKSVFIFLKSCLEDIFQHHTPRLFRQHFYKIIDELETEPAVKTESLALV